MLIDRTHHGFFDDLASYLICMISLTLTCELYRSGSVTKYAYNHTVKIDGKQIGRRLIFYPAALLDQFFSAIWPTQLRFDEESIFIPTRATLQLSVFDKPFYALAQSMFVNYFERHRPEVEAVFGSDPDNWSPVWNFGRVIRNSVAHGGRVYFRSPSSFPVSWQGLTYRPSDNGRCILHDDLWVADLIYLMMDMDGQLQGRRDCSHHA